MNARVAKEMRLLLPAYAMALLLAIVPVWLLPKDAINTPAALALYPFWFGAMMLALSSFGREFSLKTFPLILAQPLERARTWWTKVAVLAAAMATIFAIWCLSCAACVQRPVWGETVTIGGTMAAVTFAGGLWTTLLLRQVTAAFWFTILIPLVILMVIGMNGGTDVMMFVALGLYSVAGFLWAWRQFLRAEETTWTGGVITFPGWRTAHAASQPSTRKLRPLAALFWKEFQLHQVSLVGIGSLFVLHLGVVALRHAAPEAVGDTMRSGLQVFGGLWLLVPWLAGSLSVAEERKMGTMDGHLCLPVSSRAQFALKLVFVLVLGGLLSAVLLWTAEGIGSATGAGADFSALAIPFKGSVLGVLCLCSLGFSLIGFYASTLARNLVQALAVAVVTAMVVWGLALIASSPRQVFGIWLWETALVHYIAWPTLVATFLWLSHGNFRCGSESWPLWRRNVLAMAGALVFITAFTAGLYHRAWELVTPLEPAHGPPRLAGAKPTKISIYGGSTLLALLPDGRLWRDRILYDPGRVFLRWSEGTGIRIGGDWISLAGNHLVAGSNWMDAVANYTETVGIRSDGTLWVSEKPRQTWGINLGKPPAEELPPLVRFGNETNWQSVVRESQRSVVLLKQDGTLWRWGTHSFKEKEEWLGLRTFEPFQLGADWDWVKILRGRIRVYAWKRDGRAWILHTPGMQRFQILDNTQWQSLAAYGIYEVGVREDGTLWAWDSREGSNRIRQIGKDADWTAATGEFSVLSALKSDGSLWKWNLLDGGFPNDVFPGEEDFGFTQRSPARLGNHRDWVALGSGVGGTISLAADGTLWYWSDLSPLYHSESDQPRLLTPSRKPAKIENILGQRQ